VGGVVDVDGILGEGEAAHGVGEGAERIDGEGGFGKERGGEQAAAVKDGMVVSVVSALGYGEVIRFETWKRPRKSWRELMREIGEEHPFGTAATRGVGYGRFRTGHLWGQAFDRRSEEYCRQFMENNCINDDFYDVN